MKEVGMKSFNYFIVVKEKVTEQFHKSSWIHFVLNYVFVTWLCVIVNLNALVGVSWL